MVLDCRHSHSISDFVSTGDFVPFGGRCHNFLPAPASASPVLSGTRRHVPCMVPSFVPDSPAYFSCKNLHASDSVLLDVRRTLASSSAILRGQSLPLIWLQERLYHRDRRFLRFCHFNNLRQSTEYCARPNLAHHTGQSSFR